MTITITTPCSPLLAQLILIGVQYSTISMEGFGWFPAIPLPTWKYQTESMLYIYLVLLEVQT